MGEREGNTLRHAEGLLQEGKSDDARQLLIAYLKRIPNSAEAWWLLSQTITDTEQRKDCLKRVLRFDPNHVLARTHLELLNDPSAVSASPFTVPVDDIPATYQPSLETSPSRSQADAFSSEIETPKESYPKPVPAFKDFSEEMQVESTSAPPSSAKKRRPPSKKKQKVSGWIIALVLIVLCIGIMGIGYFGIIIYGETNTKNTPTPLQTVLPTNTPRPPQSLPPTWTLPPSPPHPPTHTPTPTATPSQTLQPIATFTKPPRITGVSVDQYAPDFALKNLASGDQVSLGNYAGQPIVIVFWATWCPYCEQEISALNSVYKKYKDQGLVILGVNTGDSTSNVRSYQSSHNISYPILLDSKKNIMTQYKVSSIPFHYLINANGKITYASSGMFETTALEHNVKILIADTSTQ